MTAAGLAAFATADPERSGVYSFERKTAKQEETRQRRLAALIAACAAGRPLGP